MIRYIPFVVLIVLTGCLKGGGETDPGRDPPSSSDIALPDGYRIELVADGLEYLKAVRRAGPDE